MKMPVVSIILPVYNGALRIQEAVRSVISQSYVDWELLVIDDGSTDKTSEVADNFTRNEQRIRYIKNEQNLGIQKTLNRGLREAKGEYIARIDDDDVWVDVGKLDKQLKFFSDHQGHVLVGTGATITDHSKAELGRFLMPEKDADIRKKILSKNCFIHSSVFFKRSVALEVGGYDESEETRHIEDYDLWLKLGTIGKFANIPEYCVSLAQEDNTISQKNRIVQARHSLGEIRKFKDKYPNFLKGKILTIGRLLFFLLGKMFPLNIKLLSKIKTIYKES